MINGFEAKVGSTIRRFTLDEVEERDTFTGGDDSKWWDIEIDDSSNKDVPESVTPRQIKRALVLSGFALSTIEGFLNNIEDEQDKALALIDWEYATEFKRNYGLVSALGPQIGFTEKQLDDLWILAETL